MATSLFNQVVTKLDQSRGTELEKKVKIATSPDNWNASSTLKTEIAQATYDYQGYREVMPMLWKRMNETNKNWAIVFKSLGLLEHLLRCGSERVIDEARERMFQLRSLQDFYYTSEDGKDRGHGIREMSRSLCELLNDKERLQQMRVAASRNQEKYVGMSNSGSVARPTGIGSSYASYSSDSYASSRYAGYSSDRPPEPTSSYDPYPAATASSRREVPTTRTPADPSPSPISASSSRDDPDSEPAPAVSAKKSKKIVVKVAAPNEVKAPRAVKLASTDDSAKSGAASAAPAVGVPVAAAAAVPSSTPLFDMFNVFDNPPANAPSTWNPSFDDEDDNDGFDPRASRKPAASAPTAASVSSAAAAVDDWSPFSSAPAVAQSSAPASVPFAVSAAPTFNVSSMGAPAAATSGYAHRVEFDPFASSPPLPGSGAAVVSSPPAPSPPADDEWGDTGFVSGAKKAEAPKAAAAASGPKDLAWDSGLVNLNLKGESAAKKQPLAAGPSMADLRGGNSLDGLGLPRAAAAPQPWIGGLPNTGMSTAAGGSGFPGMMGGMTGGMQSGMGMNMNMNMNMGNMGGMGGFQPMNMGMNTMGMTNMGMGFAPMGGMGGMSGGMGMSGASSSPFFPPSAPSTSATRPAASASSNIFF